VRYYRNGFNLPEEEKTIAILFEVRIRSFFQKANIVYLREVLILETKTPEKRRRRK